MVGGPSRNESCSEQLLGSMLLAHEGDSLFFVARSLMEVLWGVLATININCCTSGEDLLDHPGKDAVCK